MPRRQVRQLPPRSPFAAQLRQALTDDGLTQEQAARKVDVTLRTLQHWLKGNTEPQAATLIRVARALERDPEWFYPEDLAA